MKILVGIKRVVDYNVRVRLAGAGAAARPDIAGLKMSINPFDEIALEAAVRLKEAGAASEIIAVSVGPAKAEDVLRSALALGADRAILVAAEPAPGPLAIAAIFAALVKAENVSLALLGKQAIDDDSGQTGPMLAAKLGWPQLVCASAIKPAAEPGGVWQVECETDQGAEILAASLPAVITADLRLNEPRYASLANIMKARKKPIEHKSLSDLGLELKPQAQILAYAPPPARPAGIMLASAAELAARLQADGLLD